MQCFIDAMPVGAAILTLGEDIVFRATYSLGTLLLSWLLMQAVHEAGHVLAGWCVGDRIERVVLHPAAISRTDLSPGNQRLWTTAAGPVFGAVVPLLLWVIGHFSRLPMRSWLRFFAGFCLIANGAYLGVAFVQPVGDAEVLLRHGAPLWTLLLFGVIAVTGGLALWHGLGPQFGWGAKARIVGTRDVICVVVGLVLVVVLEMLLSPR
jgi:hypothetical protein